MTLTELKHPFTSVETELKEEEHQSWIQSEMVLINDLLFINNN